MSIGQRGITRSTKENENKLKREINLKLKNSECACFLPLGEMSEGQRGITRSTNENEK
jgi:hypothetical protein